MAQLVQQLNHHRVDAVRSFSLEVKPLRYPQGDVLARLESLLCSHLHRKARGLLVRKLDIKEMVATGLNQRVAPVIQSLVSAQAKSMLSPPRGQPKGDKGRGRGQGGGQFRYWITCYKCGQAGHYQADCPNGPPNRTGQPQLPPPGPPEPPPPGLEIKGGGRGSDKGNGGRGPGG